MKTIETIIKTITATLMMVTFAASMPALAQSSTVIDIEVNQNFKRGTAALLKGDLKTAQHKLRQAIRSNMSPEMTANSYNNLCVADQRLGHFKDAMQDCTKAAKIDRSNWRAQMNMGVMYILIDQPAKAQTYLAKAKKLNKKEVVIDKLMKQASNAIEANRFAAK